jgi:hypothetical protein
MCCRRNWLVDLPEELLWTIMGLLDMPSLRTVRLVSKGLCQAASGRVESASLHTSDLHEPPLSFLNRFTGLAAISVTTSNNDRLQVLAQPGMAATVTSLNMCCTYDYTVSPGSLTYGYSDTWLAPADLEHLEHLPNLQSVSLEVLGRLEDCHMNILPLLPLQLQTLTLNTTGKAGAEKCRFPLLRGASQAI